MGRLCNKGGRKDSKRTGRGDTSTVLLYMYIGFSSTRPFFFLPFSWLRYGGRMRGGWLTSPCRRHIVRFASGDPLVCVLNQRRKGSYREAFPLC